MDTIYWVAVAAAAIIALNSIWLSFWVIRKTQERAAHAVTLAWCALTEVGRAVTIIDQFAAEEHRTMESMKGFISSGPAGNAQLRGLEVYRNGYVDVYQKKILKHLRQYNKNTQKFLEIAGDVPSISKYLEEEEQLTQ